MFKESLGQPQNLLITLFIVLFSLVILDKSLNSNYKKKTKKETTETIEKEELTKKSKFSNIDIPEMENPSHRGEIESNEIPVIVDSASDQVYTDEKETKEVYVYYLKFYGKGNKSYSKLVRVPRVGKRKFISNLKTVLKSLVLGPSSTEQEKGMLTSLPGSLRFSKKVRLENGILYLIINAPLDKDVGPELAKDRLDQLIFSLTELRGVEGVVLYYKDKPLYKSSDGNNRPIVLTKTQRKVVYF